MEKTNQPAKLSTAARKMTRLTSMRRVAAEGTQPPVRPHGHTAAPAAHAAGVLRSSSVPTGWKADVATLTVTRL